MRGRLEGCRDDCSPEWSLLRVGSRAWKLVNVKGRTKRVVATYILTDYIVVSTETWWSGRRTCDSVNDLGPAGLPACLPGPHSTVDGSALATSQVRREAREPRNFSGSATGNLGWLSVSSRLLRQFLLSDCLIRMNNMKFFPFLDVRLTVANKWAKIARMQSFPHCAAVCQLTGSQISCSTLLSAADPPRTDVEECRFFY